MKTRQKITEEMKAHTTWYEQAKNQTLESLHEFITGLMEDYEHDYGTICHALAAGSIATAWAMNSHNQGGITGFQAGAVMWEYVRNWNYKSNECGLKLIDYDNFLYPQHEQNFDKVIPKSVWDKIKEKAKENLANQGQSHPSVIKHWESIANDKIPFGYRISED